MGSKGLPEQFDGVAGTRLPTSQPLLADLPVVFREISEKFPRKNHFLLSTMAWKSECSTKYLTERMASYYATCVRSPDAPHCLLSGLAVRENGDAQVKLRWTHLGKSKQAAPRPWAVDLFLREVEVPPGHDASHICGKGLSGCVDPAHIVVEPHEVNLDRRDCHKLTTCPCPCAMVHRVRTKCDHVPPCL